MTENSAKVIVLAGVDGAGKSRHARRLLKKLEENRRVKYIWMRGRGRVFLSLPLLVICRLLGITQIRKLKKGIKVSEYPFYAYKPLRLLWPWLQLIDSMIYSAILIHLPRFSSRDTIIIDRSVVDTLVDIVADVRRPWGKQLLHRLFLSLLPKNSQVIILDVSAEVAITRKNDIPSRQFIGIRRRIYKLLAEGYNWDILSTEDAFEVVNRTLLQIVGECRHDNMGRT